MKNIDQNIDQNCFSINTILENLFTFKVSQWQILKPNFYEYHLLYPFVSIKYFFLLFLAGASFLKLTFKVQIFSPQKCCLIGWKSIQFLLIYEMWMFSVHSEIECFVRIKQQLMVAQLFIIANFLIKESKPLIIINYVINLHSFQLNIKYTNWKYQFLMDFHDFKQQLYVTVAWFNYVHICNLCQTGKTLQTSLQAPAV